MRLVHLLPLIAGAGGMYAAYRSYRTVLNYPAGSGRVAEIADAIHKGALAFLSHEYRILGMFALVVAVLLGMFLSLGSAVAFLFGAASSSLAGFIGMSAATRANVRTAVAAQGKGRVVALRVAFLGGSIMGLAVASLALIGLGTLYLFVGNDPAMVHVLQGFGMGASTVALFARVGGGIYTKSADVGADLVGKVEAGIPEDDPRNPGVIADNVGDNVGDVAGMGADIFESYVGATVASVTLAAGMALADMRGLGAQASLMFLPLMLGTVGLLASGIGIYLVEHFSKRPAAVALHIGTLGGTFAFMLLALLVTAIMDVSVKVWLGIIAGAFAGVVIGVVTDFYTRGTPVKNIAKSAQTGPATVVIVGLALGMNSVVIPIITLCAAIYIANALGGPYGIGIAAVGMLATVGITMAIDAFGPVADNAGGIAEMGAMGAHTRGVTDELDELGNTTAAVGKGFAIGSAALTALALTTSYIQEVGRSVPDFRLDLGDPEVLMGLFLGGTIPFLVAAMTMTAVGNAAYAIVEEIRRQFREIPGLLEGTGKPDPVHCIDIATDAALKRMVAPGVLVALAPVLVGFIVGPKALGGMLAGALVTGVFLALTMSNAGGAWDNAKKWVEKGHLGGKGSDVHKACVVGDTIGDPFKDTSGPSMNILIKVMAIVALVIAPLLG